MTAIEELLYAAEAISPLRKIRDFDQDRLNAMQEQLSDPIYLAEVERDLDVLDVLAHTEVSDSVRKDCKAELAAAAKRGWTI